MLNLLTHDQLWGTEGNKQGSARNQFAPNKGLVYYNGSDDPTRTALSYLIHAKRGGKKKWSHVDTEIKANSDTHELHTLPRSTRIHKTLKYATHTHTHTYKLECVTVHTAAWMGKPFPISADWCWWEGDPPPTPSPSPTLNDATWFHANVQNVIYTSSSHCLHQLTPVSLFHNMS